MAEGEGKMSLATRVIQDKGRNTMLLTNVRREEEHHIN